MIFAFLYANKIIPHSKNNPNYRRGSVCSGRKDKTKPSFIRIVFTQTLLYKFLNDLKRGEIVTVNSKTQTNEKKL